MAKILIAEDETRIADFIERGLQRYGFVTAIANDGIAAVEMASTGEFDLLLLDLGLPGKDGWQVLEELRQHPQHPIEIIIVTARDDLTERLKSISYGIKDYVAKPFKFSDLLARVQSCLK